MRILPEKMEGLFKLLRLTNQLCFSFMHCYYHLTVKKKRMRNVSIVLFWHFHSCTQFHLELADIFIVLICFKLITAVNNYDY